MTDGRVARIITAFAGLAFAASVAVFAFLTYRTLGQPAIDMWGFRPAQTLISVPYMLSEGAWLSNIVPLFGEPWTFTQEFPLYQWLVAALVQVGLPLESAGRLVSAFFTLACVGPIYLIAATVDPANRVRTTLFVSTLWLLAPPVLFWGRSTLIESTVVFLGLGWLAFYIRFVGTGRLLPWVLCVVLGALAATVKVTAFAGFVMAAFLYTLHFMFAQRRELLRYGLRLTAALLCVVVSAVALVVWSNWTSEAWKLNPLASQLLLSNMPQWYFGNLNDRLTPPLWTWAIMGRALPNIFGSAWTLLAVAALVMAIFAERLRLALSLVACFLIGFLVFPQLFMQNIYYEVENAIFVVAIIGVVAAALVSTRWWLVGCSLFAVAVALQGWTLATGSYGHQFFDDLKQHPYYLAGVRVREMTPPDSVVVVFGTGWGSDVPLVAERRGLVLPVWASPPAVEEILFTNREKWLGGRSIGAVVDCNVFTNQAIDPQLLPVRDRLYAELPPDEEIVSGPVGNGSIDNPACTIRYAAPPG